MAQLTARTLRLGGLGGLLFLMASGCAGERTMPVLWDPPDASTGVGGSQVPGGNAGDNRAKGGGGNAGGNRAKGGGGNAGGNRAKGGGGGSVQLFTESPKVGDSVPNTKGGPEGKVTAVSSSSDFTMVTLSYPGDWDCPDAGVSTPEGAPVAVVDASTPTANETAALAVTDCKNLAALRRLTLKNESQTRLASARQSLLASKCQPRTESHCIDSNGMIADSKCRALSPAAGGGGKASAPSSATADNSEGATQYSTTNTQVATVDEADYVKNDANTIFVLAADGLHVVDGWPAAETHEIAKLALPGEPRRLFLEQNRLVVYTRMQTSTTASAVRGGANPSDQGCTYGYGCRFTSEGGHTLALVYDVTTPAAPRELVRYEFSGGYVASRRVGSYVYTVLHDAGPTQVSGVDYTLRANSFAELESAYAAQLAANDVAIDNMSDNLFLPWTQTTKPDGSVTANSTCNQALAGVGAQGMSFVSLQSFDLTTLTAPTRMLLATNPGYVYASPEALYLAADKAPEPTSIAGYRSYGNRAVDSVIHKFKLLGTETKYIGSSVLPGHILNQFAMDEDLGVLRVASTAGWVPDANVVSYITTIGETATGFQKIGQIGGIAPTEDIRSVRFDGDRGYVVTFKKTDPLFVFDLKDPAAPKMLGELKIPGFSTYMHRLDANHLLAVGFEADDKGSFAYFNGIQIQIFDVTDLSNPSLLWKHIVGTRGSNSEGLTNHLAFNYFAPKKMLALPITICEGGGDGSYGQLTFAGLMAFDISLETGIKEHGRLPFVDANTVSASANCNQWWTNSKSLVKRSIIMDDWIYGLSDAQLRVAPLASMTQVLQSVPLTK